MLIYERVADSGDAAADHETWAYYPCATDIAGIANAADIVAVHSFSSCHFAPFQDDDVGLNSPLHCKPM